MVTDTLRGCTVSCTHCSRSEAKRWGSSARSQASCREQLRAEGAAAGRGGGGQGDNPSPPAPAQRGCHPHLGEPSSFTLYPVFTGVKVGRPSLSQSWATAKRGAPHPGETRRCSKGSCDCPTCTGRPRGALSGPRLPGPSGPPCTPPRLTCCAGRTSRSGGPVTPGTAHMTHTAHSSPQAPESPGRMGTSASGPHKAHSRDPGQPHLPTATVCPLNPVLFPYMRGAPISGLSPAWSCDPDLATSGQTGRVSPLGSSGQEAVSWCRGATQRRTDSSSQSHSSICLDSEFPTGTWAHQPQS